MSAFLWFLIGAWIGAPLGYLAAALAQAAGRADAHLPHATLHQADQELAPAHAINRDNWSNE